VILPTRKIIAWPLAHGLYHIGHLFSIIVVRDGNGAAWRCWWNVVAYHIYNWCMTKSLDINDWAGLTLWRYADSECGEKSAGA
jgi:hypothetical protein